MTQFNEDGSIKPVRQVLQEEAELEALRAENARLRAELASAPRWVPVAERLPGKAQPWEYIVARLNNGAHVSAIHDGEQWLEFDNEIEDWIPLVNVTHWYRVPELVPHAPEVER